MTRVLVTGATGFVGRELCNALSHAGCVVRAALRSDCGLPAGAAEKVVVGEIDSRTNWSNALAGVDAVVHAAGRAHVLNDHGNAELYEETNARGTRRLAEAASAAGVSRLVFVSSIKVNGEHTNDTPFRPSDLPRPADDYARSKWRAEAALVEVSQRTGLEVVTVRPPLVYGPAVRANFLRLLESISKGWPLPLGAINNKRSLVSVWNLCDLIVRTLLHRGSASGVWLVSDGEDLSTPDLVRRLARHIGVPARLLPVPQTILMGVGALLGKAAEMQRLCGSMVLDISATCAQFNWRPPLSVDESIARTAQWFTESHARARKA